MTVTTDSCEPGQDMSSMIRVITSSSKWLFSLAVIGTGLIAVFLFLMGFLIVIFAILHTVLNPEFTVHFLKELLATFIEIIDIFLVATVFYIIALGLYELFIAKAPLPGWLRICNLDDLKDSLLGMIIIALAVLVLGAALTWDGTGAILGYGLAVAAGIAAISLYVWVKH
jgi:uncharacterized membrane protein YqhA